MDIHTVARTFDRDGFVIVPKVLAAGEIAEIEKEVGEYIANVAPGLQPGQVYYEDSPARPVKAMHRLNEHSEFFRKLQSHPRVLELARTIWPAGEIIPESVMYFGKPARDGSVTPPHQDNFFQH